MALTSGMRLGPYLVSDPIGAGGMGEVYRATDTTLGRDVALKVLPDLVATDAERLVRFEREARTLASLNHPHIATLHGLERSGGTLALVMELVDGPTLADRIATGPLPLDEALQVARQIADALEAAHAQGIVHRDLKPANVKVRRDGTVKVLDFGLARVLEPAAAAAGPVSATVSPTIISPAQTMHGVILGTAAYMSPEQARGRAVDARADIWAFGCVLYEMLTGLRAFGPSAVRRDDTGRPRGSGHAAATQRSEPPAEDDDVSLTLARVLERDVDLEALPPGVPSRVRQAIAVCLRRDLRQRARAIGDVRLALDGAFEDAAPPVVVPASRATWLRTAFALAAGVVLAAAALMPFVRRAEAPPPVTRFQIFAPAGSRLPLGTPAVSADGRMLAYTVADTEGITRIHVRALDRTDSRVLPGTEGAIHPFWSPDGRAIAFAAQSDGQLKRIELDAGLPRSLTGVTAPWHGSWGGDSILIMASPVPSRIPADGGLAEPVAQTLGDVDERLINFPEFLPDGRRFLVRVTAAQKSSIQLATLGSLARTLVVDNVTSAPLVTRTPDGSSHLLYLRASDLLVHEFDEPSGTVRGDPRVLVTNVGQVASPPIRPAVGVSPAGILAYQTGGIGTIGQIGWVSRTGAEVRALTLDASVRGPRLSPDETLVAGHRFDEGETSVWITDLRRGTSTRLTFGGNASEPVWSPDGIRLAFRRTTGAVGLHVMSSDGADERRLTGSSDIPTSWSRDGWLLYQSSGRLLMTPVDREEKPVDVGSVNGLSRHGEFSPDGRFIAYTSDESGRNEVYVRAGPPGRQRIKLSIEGGTNPQWRGDGREIYFISVGNELMAVDIATGDRITAGVPRPLFRTAGRNMTSGYAVRADGQQFLVPRLDLQDAPITVVLNWWRDLVPSPR